MQSFRINPNFESKMVLGSIFAKKRGGVAVGFGFPSVFSQHKLSLFWLAFGVF